MSESINFSSDNFNADPLTLEFLSEYSEEKQSIENIEKEVAQELEEEKI